MGSNQIRLFFLLAVTCVSAVLQAQSLPQINLRFSNPSFDPKSREYTLDAEMSTASTKENLFGMNVRFFYDANLLEFKKIDQISSGYGLLGENPKVLQGNEQSGIQMFGWSGSASYVNAAIQQQNETSSLEITPDAWVKVFRISFKVPVIFLEEQKFCPGVIWDVLSTQVSGGFLPGSDGVVVTVIENDPYTRNISAKTSASATFFNWTLTSESSMPYGHSLFHDCISITEVTTATEDPNMVDQHGYALFQNTPNPFVEGTSIAFVLPFAQDASMKFYDVSGKSYEEVKGFYKEGQNSITIERKPWMQESKIVFYRLETQDYSSELRKMTLINK